MNLHNETKTITTSRLIFGGALLVALTLIGWVVTQKPSKAAEMIVHKSPTCGCCSAWVEHLRKNGFVVEVQDHLDLRPFKSEVGVPNQFRSCHTAMVEGYVIEGHVPAEEIKRLLDEKPAVKGLAVPGMPMGSPGMEGPRQDAYDVLTFDENGKTTVYASRNQ